MFKIFYLVITVIDNPPLTSLIFLTWGLKLGYGAEKINELFTQGSKGPILFPIIQELEALHHPQLEW